MYGLNEAQIKKISPAMLDLAAVTGSTESASRLLGQAIEHGTGRLGMYGVNMDKVKKSHDRFNEVLTQVEASMGGQSAAAYAAMSPLEKMSRTVDEISMAFAKAFVPTLEKVATWLTKNKDKISDFMNDLSTGLNWLVTSSEGICISIAAIGAALTAAFLTNPVGAAAAAVAVSIASIVNAVGKSKNEIIQHATEIAGADIKIFDDDRQARLAQIELMKISESQKAKLRKEAHDNEIADIQKYEEAVDAATSKMYESDKIMQKLMVLSPSAIKANEAQRAELLKRWGFDGESFGAMLKRMELIKDKLEEKKHSLYSGADTAGPKLRNGQDESDKEEEAAAKEKLKLINQLAHDAGQIGMNENQKELADLEETHEKEKIMLKGNNAALLNEDKVYAAKKKALIEQGSKARNDAISKAAKEATRVGMTAEQKEIADLDDNLKEQQELVGANLEAQANLMEVYNDKKKAIEEKYSKALEIAQNAHDKSEASNFDKKYQTKKAKLKKEYEDEKKILEAQHISITELTENYTRDDAQVDKEAKEAKTKYAEEYTTTALSQIDTLVKGMKGGAGAKKAIAMAEAGVDAGIGIMGVVTNSKAYIANFGPVGGPIAMGVEIALITGIFAEQLANISSQKMAAGGVVSGGIPGRDSVPALLMPGEIVYNPARPDPNLANMISGGGGSTTTQHLNMGDIHIHGNANSATVAALGKAQEKAVYTALRRMQQSGRLTAPGLKIRG